MYEDKRLSYTDSIKACVFLLLADLEKANNTHEQEEKI